MEVYEAKYNYVKERDDVLSFTKGEKFYITSKTNEKWWAAKKVVDNTFGYVPSVYLKQCVQKVIGRLVPEGRRDTEEHKIHLRALAEIHKKVKPLPVRARSASCPAHVIGRAIGVELIDSSDEDDEPRKLPQKQIQIPKTALRLEGLTGRDKPPLPPPQHKHSNSHRGCPFVAMKMPSPTSPTLPMAPTLPNQLPPYKKHSWPHLPPSSEVPGYHHHHSIFPSKGSRNDDDDDDDDDDDLPEYLKMLSPPPMASPPPPDYDMEDETKDRNDMPFHHKLNSSGRYSSLSSEDSNDLSPMSPAGDDAFLIKPKFLPNPVKDSREHKQLHRELRLSYKTGGPLPQKSELSVVNRERKLEERKKEIENDKKIRRTSMELKLQERQDKERMEEEKVQRMAKMKEQEAIEEEKKPEFMKVRLKQTNSKS